MFRRSALMGRDASGTVQQELYQSKAAECIDHARGSNDPHMRITWLELAAMWLKLVPLAPSREGVLFDQETRNRSTGQASDAEH